MKNSILKKAVPHIIAIGIFLLAALIFCKPALESGVVLQQHDTSSWKAMAQQSFEYKKAHGHFPLWNVSMFSGMPAFQIALEGAWSPLPLIDTLIQLGLPQPFNFFFLACISFYFLCLTLRLKPWAAILGSLAFAYCSYSPIIISAGHVTKMLAMGYAPFLMGACILIFQRKYLMGFSLASLFAALQIGQGHQQVSYYLMFILVFMTVAYGIRFFKAGQNSHFLKATGLMLLAGLIGIGSQAVSLFPTYDYAKESKRGGQLVMSDDTRHSSNQVAEGKTVGMSKEYAFQWSYGIAETMSLIFPGVKGVGFHYTTRDGETSMFPKVKDNGPVMTYMSETLNFPPQTLDQVAPQMSQSLYWGKQPFTGGPVYIGAIICFLALLGMFYLDNKHKWWMMGAAVFGILLSWGHNFAAFNNFMFDYFPIYNKFRVPTMALIIPQLLLPLLAALTLSRLAEKRFTSGLLLNEKELDWSPALAWKKFLRGCMATGIVIAIGLAYYASADFGNENPERTRNFNSLYEAKDPQLLQKIAGFAPEKDNQLYEAWVLNFQGAPEAQKMARAIVDAEKKERAALFFGDILRSILFIAIGALLIGLFLKEKLSALAMLIGITLASTIDVMSYAAHFMDKNSYESKDVYEQEQFGLTEADKQILADKDPHYRVFNMTGSPFENALPSYHHKSIGGYHAAKLGIYDDLTSYQLSSNMNLQVLNMLNTKYVIQQGQEGPPQAIPNPEALGNAWLVKGVQFVNGPQQEMKALNDFNPRDTAIVDDKFKSVLGNVQPTDSASFIKMTKFDNDEIAYTAQTSSNQLAVFSEIYYKDWKAYIDGKEVPIIKANYVLRALIVPAGKHTIIFKFEPAVYYTSRTISNLVNWFIVLLLVASAGYLIYRKRKKLA